METTFSKWLSKKLYLITLGTYATICIIMILSFFLTNFFAIPPIAASFISFFIILFLYTAYENVIVYETPVKNLSLPKMLIPVLVPSITMSLISYFMKPSIGYFSIPVAVIISLIFINELKATLWPTTECPDFFTKLSTKLKINKISMYGFYVFFVNIVYIAYKKYNFDFYYTFIIGILIGIIFEETFNLIKLYEQKLTLKSLTTIIITSIICSISCTAIVILMMNYLGFTSQIASITSIFLLKLIQPLISRKFILKL